MMKIFDFTHLISFTNKAAIYLMYLCCTIAPIIALGTFYLHRTESDRRNAITTNQDTILQRQREINALKAEYKKNIDQMLQEKINNILADDKLTDSEKQELTETYSAMTVYDDLYKKIFNQQEMLTMKEIENKFYVLIKQQEKDIKANTYNLKCSAIYDGITTRYYNLQNTCLDIKNRYLPSVIKVFNKGLDIVKTGLMTIDKALDDFAADKEI